MTRNTILALFFCLLCLSDLTSQHSVARKWNETLLDAIRNDFARPTIHARNLFHISMAMYDSWAVYDDKASTIFLGQNFGGYNCDLNEVIIPTNLDSVREITLSYATYRILLNRFASSPGAATTIPLIHSMMTDTLGYDKDFVSNDYSTGNAAALGNYLAEQIIAFGYTDGSNQTNDYANINYETVNPPLLPIFPGNPDIVDPNRWQSLALEFYVDQAGNLNPTGVPPFLGPEWGKVVPFAMESEDLTIKTKNLSVFPFTPIDYWIYHDPGSPPTIDTITSGGLSDEYKWGFELVSIWASHLDTADHVMVDISPASFGNFDLNNYPNDIPGLRTFYDSIDGGDPGTGRSINPKTGLPYVQQFVSRGDYARVLAEFWADGPESETPPGHWFTILNYVSDHPLFEKKYKGAGPILNDLEWDVKSYLTMAGGVHDAAVAAWGVKGYYDYLRPISAIRYLADLGQCTDANKPNYHVAGINLRPGFIELVEIGDPLAGPNNEHVDKIKLYTWKGPDSISNPASDMAGVGWILAENWWPYQRPTFVTPPFAGYVSGHSTFSRAAAEIMTLLTGDEFFPGGMGEFIAPKNDFLVFEQGPSEDLTLQWATYRDASDQTSLSRIWGGIHPPADDIPGRIMGYKIGHNAFNKAENYFSGIRRIYVDESSPVDANGKSWLTPCNKLTTALDSVDSQLGVNEIRLAQGTYLTSSIGDRSKSAEIHSNTIIKGGYTANVSLPDERNPTLYPTIISGDIGVPSDDSDNAYHVVSIPSGASNIILDGVIIEDGNANGNLVEQQKGAGIYNLGDLILRNVTIRNCSSSLPGDVMYIKGPEARIIALNCVVE